MDHQPLTIADHINKHGITLRVLSGPTVAWDADAGSSWRHYRFIVRLTAANGRTLDAPWRQGEGHGTRTPDATLVLDAVASDARSWVEAEDFADFASTTGYDLSTPDGIRKAHGDYGACAETYDKLGDLLGEADRDALLFETETL